MLASGKNHSIKYNRLSSSIYCNLDTQAAFNLTKISKNVAKADHVFQDVISLIGDFWRKIFYPKRSQIKRLQEKVL